MDCEILIKIFLFYTFLYSVKAEKNNIEKKTMGITKKSVNNSSDSRSQFSAAKECGCSSEVKPVCADNGVTYKNLCTLRCENKRRKQNQEQQLYVRCYYDCVVCVVIEWYKRSNGIPYAFKLRGLQH